MMSSLSASEPVRRYELNHQAIVPRHAGRGVGLQEIRSWRRISLRPTVSEVVILTTDGRELRWLDRNGELVALLQSFVARLELPGA